MQLTSYTWNTSNKLNMNFHFEHISSAFMDVLGDEMDVLRWFLKW